LSSIKLGGGGGKKVRKSPRDAGASGHHKIPGIEGNRPDRKNRVGQKRQGKVGRRTNQVETASAGNNHKKKKEGKLGKKTYKTTKNE